MKNIGIYARVSTKDQSVEQQLSKLREYCKRADYEIVDEYIDEGVSALKKTRPEFERLLKDVRSRKINVILVWKLDRFSRSLKELVNTLDYLKEHNAEFVSYSQPELDTRTSSGKLLFTIISAISEFERDLISERTKLKLNLLKQNGIKLGRPKSVDDTKVIELRKSGLSLSQIGRELDCHRSTVCRVLQKGMVKPVLEKVTK